MEQVPKEVDAPELVAGFSEIKSPSVLERHVQTILVTIVTVLLLWVGKNVSDYGESIARLQEQIAALSSRLDSVNGLADRVNRLELRVGIIEDRENSRGKK